MRVEIDVFSGRPNPTWELAPGPTAALLQKISVLSVAAKPVPPPGLGYRGFVLYADDSTIRVLQGLVTIEQDGNARVYADQRGLERDLHRLARENGYAALLASLGPPPPAAD